MKNILNLKEKNEFLEREYNTTIEKKTMIELEIALQKKLDPEEMSATKTLARGPDGRPISSREITRKEYIKIKEDDLDAVNLRLDTIKELSDKE
jgi:hypothetical protein